MVYLANHPILVLPFHTYRDHFLQAENNTFCRRYSNVLLPYWIDPSNATASTTPQEVYRKIYPAAQGEVPTKFIQWNMYTEVLPNISLLHSVSSYVSCMGMLASLWEALYLMMKGEVTCGNVRTSH